MESPEKQKKSRSTSVLIGTAIICLLIGGVFGYAMSSLATSSQISDLQGRTSNLEKQVSNLQSTNSSSSSRNVTENIIYQNVTSENVTYVLGENFSLSQLYEQVKDSIVVVHGWVEGNTGWPFYISYYSEVQGSGFVSNSTGQFVIITNYHVVTSAINITVAFTDGNSYAANETGSDLYADLAVLSTNAPQYEYKPLAITSSSTLKVGDPVIAIGTPLGLTGSMTSGIVSALGRSVTVDWTSYPIANCIQTTAPINPGNSGGPLLNYAGEAVGITSYTATYEGVAAQGLGLAIPSSAILREIPSLVTNGSYNSHPWLGASGIDMTYEIAQAMNTNVTYGWLINQTTSGGPADKAGIRGSTRQADVGGTLIPVGGDIIIAINDTRIRGFDDLSTYLEENTIAGQTINVTIVRNNQTLKLPLEVGTRPSP
jgi:S1-C subfamily serine protease